MRWLKLGHDPGSEDKGLIQICQNRKTHSSAVSTQYSPGAEKEKKRNKIKMSNADTVLMKILLY